MAVPMLVSDFLRRAVHLYPDREAIIDGDVRYTYAQFQVRVDRLANGLAALGVQKGDRVALLAPNNHRFLECFYGVTAIGAVLVPLNYRLVPSDFTYIINHGEAVAFIIDDELLPVANQIRPELTSIKHWICWSSAGESVPDGWQDYDALLAGASSDIPPDPGLDENDLATLNYTSGTTARPKGVMMTHRNLYANALNFIAHLAITDRDTILHTLPMFHANGWGSPFAVTAMGGRHVVLRKVDGKAIFDLIEQHGVTFACMAPAVLATILNYPDAARHQLTTAPRLTVAGAPPPAAFIKQLQDGLGWGFIQVYGLTETAPFLTVSRLKPHQEGYDENERIRIQDRAGMEMIGVDLSVVDDENVPVPMDDTTVGEVIARGNVIFAGYWRQPEETDKAIIDGWFHTGDLATWDIERTINIVDRKKDVIISGGENISSIEVEDVLYQHPSVLECAVIGVPSERWGETPKALIVLREGTTATQEEVIAHCRAYMAHFKAPTSVDFIESLPRTATGKLQKFVLRDRFWQGYEKRVH
ncbi:MAG: long-chain-fatty-acid--CoA ligase [Chloroflexi bacterium]|nr:long-chain-fatty-acid--CoA ligase [Chloroflexota bacterium]